MSTRAQRARAPHLGPDRRTPEVIEIAAHEFAANGYNGASMRRIAERAGVSKAVLYDCFPAGKDAIYDAVIDRACTRFEDTVVATIRSAASAHEMVADAARATLAFIADEPFALALFVGPNGAGGQQAVRLTQARERALGALLPALWRAAATGRR